MNTAERMYVLLCISAACGTASPVEQRRRELFHIQMHKGHRSRQTSKREEMTRTGAGERELWGQDRLLAQTRAMGRSSWELNPAFHV